MWKSACAWRWPISPDGNMTPNQKTDSTREDHLRALQESEAIAEISRVLYQNLELEAIFGQIVRAAIEIISQAYRAVIHLYDQENQRLYAVALSERVKDEIETKTLINLRVSPNNEFDFGSLDESDRRFVSMRSGQGVAGMVIESGEGIIITDTLADERFLSREEEAPLRSIIVVPILNGERRIGTLSVLGSAPDLFSPADQALLERLCLQVALAVENARLLESERQQRHLAQAQAEITSLLNQTLALDEILAGVINHTRRFFNIDAANIVLDLEGELQIVRHDGYREGDQLSDVLARPEFKQAWHEGQTATSRGGQPEWVRSSIYIPLKIGRRVIGMLNVDCVREEVWGDMERENLEVFANSAAAAINNARLYRELKLALKTEQDTRQQLIRADKLTGMGRMVASVAHELNNPLQTIKNCLFLIEQSYQDQEDPDLLELALSEVERLTLIVNRLRDVYRPAVTGEFERIEIGAALEGLEPLLETHLERHTVSLHLEMNGLEKTAILAYPDQMKQVFLNLSLNAIESMQPEGGELNVSLQIDSHQEQIGVAFSDTGPGIPEADLKVIFDPFYTTKSTGLGLGLSICYDIVHNHHGHIHAANKPEGGAVFTIWLPVN
jgi:signal transduction histidine kinase